MNRRGDRGSRPSRSIETTGRTVEDAVRSAQEELGVAKEMLDIEIVDEGRSGFLGLGAREAKIRAKVRGAAPSRPPQGSRMSERGPRREPAQGERPSQAPPRGESDLRARVHGPRDENRGRDSRGPSAGRGFRSDPRQEGGNPRQGRGAPSVAPVPSAETPRRESPIPSAPVRRDPSPARAESRTPRAGGREKELAEFTEGLLRRMEFAGGVSASFQDDGYNVSIEGGEDDGLLIGRGGETLDAIQHILLKMAGRTEDAVQIRVDISGYRSRREDQLADKAREIARQVLESGRGITVGPYKAAERRIVHRAVADIAGVSTRALGDGLMKRILIEAGADSARGEDREPIEMAEAAEPREVESRPPTVRAPRQTREPRRAAPPASLEPQVQMDREAPPPASDYPAPRKAPEVAVSKETESSKAEVAESEWGRRPKIARGMKNRR